MSVRRRIVVDEDLCQATGYCVRLAPMLFSLDSADAHVRVVGQVDGQELAALAEEAEQTCPLGAILVEEAGP